MMFLALKRTERSRVGEPLLGICLDLLVTCMLMICQSQLTNFEAQLKSIGALMGKPFDIRKNVNQSTGVVGCLPVISGFYTRG